MGVDTTVSRHKIGNSFRDKKGWTQRVGLANVSPKGLYHCIKGWFKLDNGR